MMGPVLAAYLSYWRRNPLQLFTFLAGIALATALWSGVQAINAEARASYNAAAATLGEGQYDQIVSRDGQGIAVDTYVKLRRAGWVVSPLIEGDLNHVRVIGFDPITAPFNFGGLANQTVADGDLLNGPSTLFANAETATQLPESIRVIEDINIAPGVALGDITAVQDILGSTDLSRLMVLPNQPLGQVGLADVAPSLMIQASQQTADIGQLTDSFHLNLTAFGFLSFAVGLFIVHSTIGLAFEQRRAMVRTLRAMGVSLRRVISLMMVEMIGLALLGAALGILLGYVMAGALMPDVAATLHGLYGARVSGSLQLRAEWWASGLALAVSGTLVSVSFYIWQTAKMPVLAQTHVAAWTQAHTRWLTISGVLSGLLLAGAVALAPMAQSLDQGFLLLACLLIGAALGLPVVFVGVLSLVKYASPHPVYHWFFADTRQQLGGVSLALMALLLAVSANIGVSTMVSSFRQTFVGFLDQRLAPELYVSVENAAAGQALEGYLGDHGLEVLPLYETQSTAQGAAVQLFGIRVGNTYRDNWRFIESDPLPWDRVADGAAVVVNEQFARRLGVWSGDIIDVSGRLSLPIAAVVGDYGNPFGQVILSEGVFRSLYPDLGVTQFGVRTDDPTALAANLSETLGISANGMIDQENLKALSMDVFERTFMVTGALNILTLLVAGFAILMSLLTLSDQRVPHLAPVWAMGLTRRHLGLLELLRAVMLAVIVVMGAVPLGLALAWVLLNIVNVAAFGWQLPMFLFPAEYVTIGVLAVAAAIIAASWPSARLMRVPPARLLKVFSSER